MLFWNINIHSTRKRGCLLKHFSIEARSEHYQEWSPIFTDNHQDDYRWSPRWSWMIIDHRWTQKITIDHRWSPKITDDHRWLRMKDHHWSPMFKMITDDPWWFHKGLTLMKLYYSWAPAAKIWISTCLKLVRSFDEKLWSIGLPATVLATWDPMINNYRQKMTAALWARRGWPLKAVILLYLPRLGPLFQQSQTSDTEWYQVITSNNKWYQEFKNNNKCCQWWQVIPNDTKW